MLYDENDDAVFTKENIKTHKILIPTMLPVHFSLVAELMKNFGYDAEVLTFSGEEIAQTGLKYVHSDTCYPATLVIGQFMQAILSKKYDTHKIALVISQTGGGCRASNYLHLLKKALKKAGYGYIPVLSFNVSGLAKQPGFKLGVGKLLSLLNCCIYGDLLMLLNNQTKPYEKNKGESEALVEHWGKILSSDVRKRRLFAYSHMKKNYTKIIESFAKIEKNSVKKPKVGVVGEIFVKYSPLGNNNLEEFLINEGAEVYTPGLIDFFNYIVQNQIYDMKLYKRERFKYLVAIIAKKIFLKMQGDIIKAIKKDGNFDPPTPFNETIEMGKGIIGEGMKMGEGWLLTSEMVELINRGINNIVCTQPFGCLPNHIAGKGMIKKIKEQYEDANIVAIDYDASASKVNQENRLKLMLEIAKENLIDTNEPTKRQ